MCPTVYVMLTSTHSLGLSLSPSLSLSPPHLSLGGYEAHYGGQVVGKETRSFLSHACENGQGAAEERQDDPQAGGKGEGTGRVIQCYAVLYSFIWCYTVIGSYTVLYSVIHGYTVLYSVIQCRTVLYSLLLCRKRS